HFPLAREKRNAPHLAQVHPNGVVGLGVVGIGLLLILAAHRHFLGFERFFLGDALGRDLDLSGGIDDLDVLVPQRAHHVFDLVGGDHVGRQRIVYLFVGQKPLRFSEVDELLYFLSVSAMRPVLHLFGALAPFGLVLSHRLTSSLFKAVLLARTAIYLAQKSVFCGGVSNSFATVQGLDHL